MSKQKKLATCPCCKSLRHRTETKEATEQVKTLDGKTYVYHSELDITPFDSLLVDGLHWACDPCLATGKAMLADPSSQVFSMQPRLAYWATEHSCRKCERPFLFQVTEQRYWYESLKFNLESVPINCPECRKIIRDQKRQNQELSDLFRNGEKDLSEAQLERIIAIYQQWKMEEKAKYFAGVLKQIKR